MPSLKQAARIAQAVRPDPFAFAKLYADFIADGVEQDRLERDHKQLVREIDAAINGGAHA